jgi:hypothetical protein
MEKRELVTGLNPNPGPLASQQNQHNARPLRFFLLIFISSSFGSLFESRLEGGGGVNRQNLKFITLNKHYKPGLALELNSSRKERGKQIKNQGK